MSTMGNKQMGAWNTSPFGNDAALDWLGELETSNIQFFKEVLAKFVEHSADVDSEECEIFIAASQILISASKSSIKGVPKEAKKWEPTSSIPTFHYHQTG
ncbi:DUF4259 domain-containing protein [Glaciecola sp. MH2013]|uniref:DUF4259 domain-containing protein n=1 Tax=Glaciecola sp. MH2013 TaxID=2785524 RepID=UPI00189D31DC|nr:DUF4259 domain-containing protein [Glaciecola sp. MH2013]MBF7074282.1 DUF4259 domain-containing protein [Glaciecola sp. MH2013]